MDFLFIVKAIVIAIIEGITEFIPISSTGHMIIAGDLMNFPSSEFTKMFEVVIQLGAILAIVVLFWGKLIGLVKSLFKGETRGKKFAVAYIVALIPAVIVGFGLEDFIDKYLFNTWTVLIGLFLGAVLMLIVEPLFAKRAKTLDADQISWKQGLTVGLFQCLCMWPGMSRSSSTIVGGWIGGLSTGAAAEFSFFLAIPIMAGASLIKLVKFQMQTGLQNLNITEASAFALGFLVAFLVALLCVRAFVNFLKKKPIKYFAYYRIGVSVLLAALLLTGVI